ncbi:indole-3-glycerol phosphate synthase [Ameyamaea chiangmaiensis NBRC 103196]|uniref:Indole-3-glycerol phosphate synthase n=1 Tax=Ameyamaea chiangmaiensis TaxID=442969 RepID=A0A850P7B6_9PROT|nr:indole-3-glycerol phosphate synthase TrpC [Ameyamaea chiangmaiensis]MBS4073704.1 indole-3-glycerol phosphate synthase TrpC [Ameyamaea chiangmaiensis]NVN39804.1 indole-3-glycerol phosphate synthase TrpC [Ameyamaea chiangmaiensis]GBQ68752.1 indole-3-glycerol phosphate synthase [Ameyamaea chiangmaiensis NBRC 103196]
MTDTSVPPSAVQAVAPELVKRELRTDMPDVLARIVARTRVDVTQRATILPLKDITAKAREVHEPTRGFGQALKQKTADRQVGLIAEIKKASPSAGILRAHYDPAAIAQSYHQAGAACLSVLTEGSCFHGDTADLKTARAACPLPVLRKDFMLDPWQVHESRIIGADAILLIMAMLTDMQASELLDIARGLGMDVLVEVHDEAELNRALALDTSLIGINNRNLRTLQTDIQTTFDLAPLVPPDRIVVSESGIRTHEEVMRLSEIGASGMLVGESLLREDDPGVAARRLLGFA